MSRTGLIFWIGMFAVIAGGTLNYYSPEGFKIGFFLGAALLAIGGGLVGWPLTVWASDDRLEKQRWTPLAESSTRQINAVILGLERYRDECLPDCENGQSEGILEFCKQTKHSLSSSIQQLENVRLDWIDYVRENCIECDEILRRMGANEEASEDEDIRSETREGD